MKRSHLTVVALGLAIVACDPEDPTSAVVDNDYAPPPDGGDPTQQVAVYKVWWSSTLFDTPVGAGIESSSNRVVTATEYAYALVAPNWDPASPDPPKVLVPLVSKDKLFVAHAKTLHIHVSDAAMNGSCDALQPLSQDDADFITTRIFPGDFEGGHYDAKTCTFTRARSDAGSASDGGAGGD